jgi:hypothetical protein
MVAFLKIIDSSFQGGVEGYIKTTLGFSGGDVEKMRANLKA